MKPKTISKSISAVVPLLITFILLSPLLVSCGRQEVPKKEETKAAPADGPHKDDHASEHKDVVALSPEQVKAAGVEIQEVTPGGFERSISATAVLEPNGDKVSRIGARVAGRIAGVTAAQGDRVKAGQALAYLESVELDQAWADYAKAKGKYALAASSLKREETLFEKKISPEKDVLKARQEFSEAEADVALNTKRLRILGVEDSKLGNPSDALANNHHLILIASPLAGAVIEKSVTQGEMVSPDKLLFTVSDLSSLWVVIDLYEKDLGRVKTGMEAKLLVSAYPDKIFKGRISYVGDVMDEKSRTVKARVTIDNAGGVLKPGMFATVSMDAVKDARDDNTIAVPEEAVFRDGSETLVFLREKEGRFVPRRVSVGVTSGRKIEIKDGLKAGDVVVTKGVFALKSELKKETLHDDGHGH